MHPHESLIREFYAAFARRDAEAMARCYHDEVFFSDPAFPALRGEEARDMWRMLLSRAQDLEVVLEEAGADATGGSARWSGDLHLLAHRPPGGQPDLGAVRLPRRPHRPPLRPLLLLALVRAGAGAHGPVPRAGSPR